MSRRNRAFLRTPVQPVTHHDADDLAHVSSCAACQEWSTLFPDNPYRLTSRWRNLPSFADAYDEAQAIVWALEQSGKYGWSRRTNARGVRYRGAPRFLDRFKDKKHALAAVTKTILRDRYGELPPTLTRSEVRLGIVPTSINQAGR